MGQRRSAKRGASVIPGMWVLLLSTVAAQTLPPVSFELAPETYDSAPTVQVALGDLDDDGDLDAVFANMSFDPAQVLLNDGHGVFVDTNQELTEQGHGVGVGDLDGDGDLDMFITCAGYAPEGVQYDLPSVVYLNLGDGSFVETGQDLGDTAPGGNAVSLADIDADGDLDAFVLYYGEPARVYLNDGDAWFVDSSFEFSPRTSWVDVDGDGDVDAFLKEEGFGYRVLLNEGGGIFRLWWEQSDTAVYGDFHSIAFADLDDDGDIDAFDVNGTRDDEVPMRVLFNDGGGAFTPSSQVIGNSNRAWIAMGDLNGDGHVDAFVSRTNSPNEVWLNDGRGIFTDSGLRLGGDGLTRSADLGDLDGDGDLDVFVSRRDVEGVPNEVWINCTRIGRCRSRSQPCCGDTDFFRRPSGRRRP